MHRLGLALLILVSSVQSANAGGAGDDESDLTLQLFRTPSRNIYCAYNAAANNLMCERRSPNYKLVELDGGPAKRLNYNRDLKQEYGIWAGSFELAYGKTWWASNAKLKCVSSSVGLSCHNNRGHGFKMSKAKVETY